MAIFHKNEILLTDEEKKTFKECGTFLGANGESRKRLSIFHNLLKAIDDYFVGWEVKAPKK